MNTTPILLLGILLVSPVAAEFCDGNFVTEAGNWSDIEIQDGGTVKRERYNWECDRSARWNWREMRDLSDYNLPAGTVLHSGIAMRYFPGGGRAPTVVSWIALYDVQYTYTVEYDGHIYTNDTSSMSYNAVWLRAPYRCCDTMDCYEMNYHADEMTVSPSASGVTFHLEGHVTDNDGDKYPMVGEKTIPSGIDAVHEWKAPNTEITATITNATFGCCLLELDTPANVLGYRIDAVSDNHSAFYERNFGMMQRNTTESGKEFFEIIKATTENGEGMSTFGQSKYLLPKGDYIISMVVYTPFEKIPIDITMVHEIEEVPEVDRNGAFRSLISLLTMTIGIYFVLRGL
jgi:hypothetical protein